MPRLLNEDMLHRAVTRAVWFDEETGRVTWQAFERRPADRSGLSVGFCETEDLEAFIVRTRANLSFKGVFQISIGVVRSAGIKHDHPLLDVAPELNSEVKGNIIHMPYENSEGLSQEHLQYVQPELARDLANEMAKHACIIRRQNYPKIEPQQ